MIPQCRRLRCILVAWIVEKQSCAPREFIHYSTVRYLISSTDSQQTLISQTPRYGCIPIIPHTTSTQLVSMCLSMRHARFIIYTISKKCRPNAGTQFLPQKSTPNHFSKKKKKQTVKKKLHHENAACEHAKCASGLEYCARHARCRVKMVQKRRRSAKLMSKQVVANMLSSCSAKRPAADADTSGKIRSCWRRARRWAETSIPHAVFGQLVLVESGQPIGSKVMLQCFHLLTVHF